MSTYTIPKPGSFTFTIKTLHHGWAGFLPVVVRSDGRKRQIGYRRTEEMAIHAAEQLKSWWERNPHA